MMKNRIFSSAFFLFNFFSYTLSIELSCNLIISKENCLKQFELCEWNYENRKCTALYPNGTESIIAGALINKFPYGDKCLSCFKVDANLKQ